MGGGAGGIVYLVLGDIIAETQRSHQPVGQVEIGFVEESVVGLWGIEQARNGLCLHRNVASAGTGYHGGSSLHTHTGSHRVEHAIVGIVFYLLREEGVHLRVEEHRCIGFLPLMREEGSCGTLPDAESSGFQHQFLCEGILQLFLLHVHVVQRTIVDIHQHVVVQILPAGGIGHVGIIAFIGQVQTGIHHVALVVALTVGIGVGSMLQLAVQLSVGESVLFHKLIVCREVECQTTCGLSHQPQSSTGLVHLVGPLVAVVIAEESVGAVIKTCQRECQLVVELMVVGSLGTAMETGADAQTDVSTLIVHGVLREDTHQSALGIDAIERSLRTSQHVQAIQSVEVGVECRLAHQGDIVDVDTHRGAVDTRADATHIHRRGVARAVGRHHEVGHKLRCIAQVAYAQVCHLAGCQHRGAHGLQA